MAGLGRVWSGWIRLGRAFGQWTSTERCPKHGYGICTCTEPPPNEVYVTFRNVDTSETLLQVWQPRHAPLPIVGDVVDLGAVTGCVWERRLLYNTHSGLREALVYLTGVTA